MNIWISQLTRATGLMLFALTVCAQNSSEARDYSAIGTAFLDSPVLKGYRLFYEQSESNQDDLDSLLLDYEAFLQCCTDRIVDHSNKRYEVLTGYLDQQVSIVEGLKVTATRGNKGAAFYDGKSVILDVSVLEASFRAAVESAIAEPKSYQISSPLASVDSFLATCKAISQKTKAMDWERFGRYVEEDQKNGVNKSNETMESADPFFAILYEYMLLDQAILPRFLGSIYFIVGHEVGHAALGHAEKMHDASFVAAHQTHFDADAYSIFVLSELLKGASIMSMIDIMSNNGSKSISDTSDTNFIRGYTRITGEWVFIEHTFREAGLKEQATWTHPSRTERKAKIETAIAQASRFAQARMQVKMINSMKSAFSPSGLVPNLPGMTQLMPNLKMDFSAIEAERKPTIDSLIGKDSGFLFKNPFDEVSSLDASCEGILGSSVLRGR